MGGGTAASLRIYYITIASNSNNNGNNVVGASPLREFPCVRDFLAPQGPSQAGMGGGTAATGPTNRGVNALFTGFQTGSGQTFLFAEVPQHTIIMT